MPAADQAALLQGWSEGLLAHGMSHVDASVRAAKEQKFYADSAGTSTTQQRVRIHPQLTAVLVTDHGRAVGVMTRSDLLDHLATRTAGR